MHFRCSYGPADLRCDQRFQDMVCLDGTDCLCLGFSRFDATKPLDPTESLAQPEALIQPL